MFVAGGIDSIRNSESKVKAAEAVAKPLTRAFPAMTTDTETLVKINGAVQVGAGVLLATGKFRRLASLALIGSIVPTTYAGHRFWEETDDDKRKQQWIHFLKNLGLLGGLILEVSSRPKRSDASRKRVVKKRRAARKEAAEKVRSASADLSRKGRSASVELSKKTKRLERQAEHQARIAADEAAKMATRAASEVARRSQDAAKRAGELAGQYGPVASDRAGQLISYAQDQLSHLNAA